MFELLPNAQIEQAREHRQQLIQEADRYRLYRKARAAPGKPSLAVQAALATGDLLIQAGYWLKRHALPAPPAGQLIGER